VDNSNKVTFFETPEGNLKGHLTISGWNISEAEMTVKFAKLNKNTPHKANISSSHPWRLIQLQNAYNFIKMTLAELDTLILESEVCLIHPENASYVSISKRVRQISEWLTLSRQSLMVPPKSLFPNNILTTTGFHPPLPQELHIDFSVGDAEVIVSVYALYVGMGANANGSEGLGDKLKPASSSASSLPQLLQQATSNGEQKSSSGFLKHKTPTMGNLLNLNPFVIQLPLKSEDDLKTGTSSTQIDGVDGGISLTADHKVIINGVAYRTQQCMIRGCPCTVAVLDQAEVHCIAPRINQTSEMLMNALEILADMADKLVGLSLM